MKEEYTDLQVNIAKEVTESPVGKRKKKSNRKKRDSVTEKAGSFIAEENGSTQTALSNQSQNACVPTVHIILRTHNRPKAFARCIDSINRQDYPNVHVHVIADNDQSESYAREHEGKGVTDVTPVNVADFNTQFGNFDALLKSGEARGVRDFKKNFYDLYINDIVFYLIDGWVFIVDDDKYLPDGGLISRISEHFTSEDNLVVGQYVMKSRTVPDGDKWGVLPFVRANIDMGCFVFNLKHRGLVKFDGHGAGDWRVAKKLAESLRVVWMKEPFVIADNDGGRGAGE